MLNDEESFYVEKEVSISSKKNLGYYNVIWLAHALAPLY